MHGEVPRYGIASPACLQLCCHEVMAGNSCQNASRKGPQSDDLTDVTVVRSCSGRTIGWRPTASHHTFPLLRKMGEDMIGTLPPSAPTMAFTTTLFNSRVGPRDSSSREEYF